MLNGTTFGQPRSIYCFVCLYLLLARCFIFVIFFQCCPVLWILLNLFLLFYLVIKGLCFSMACFYRVLLGPIFSLAFSLGFGLQCLICFFSIITDFYWVFPILTRLDFVYKGSSSSFYSALHCFTGLARVWSTTLILTRVSWGLPIFHRIYELKLFCNRSTRLRPVNAAFCLVYVPSFSWLVVSSSNNCC